MGLAGPFDRPVDDRGGRLRRSACRSWREWGSTRGTYVYVPARVQRPVQAPQINALAAQPRDPFVVVAAAEIDAEMVVPAPAGIDEAMVFNPYTGERQSAQAAPAPGSPLMPFPGTQPGQVPDSIILPATATQCPRRHSRVEPETECAMPEIEDAIEWDFITLVAWWNLYGLPVLLVVVAIAVLIRSRSRPATTPRQDSSRIVRRIGLIHCALAIQALIFLVQELLTMRTMGIPESFISPIAGLIDTVVNPVLGDRPAAPVVAGPGAWRSFGTRSGRCSAF